MVLNNYSLEHAPSPKDENRYKLNLSGSEDDVKKLAARLEGISSRPFPSPETGFEWSMFLYDLKDSIRKKLLSELDKVVKSKKDIDVNVGAEAGKNSGSGDESVKPRTTKLKTNLTFDTFVVGASTRFTFAACRAVAENPGKNYNPLFIYGGVGLGKTHLMQAIGNYVQEKYPDFSIAYVQTDQFINEVVEAIEKGSLNKVRSKYKKVDLLLIDDIQFLEQSESTQEEFFHIFNAMHEVGRQIVITSDKPPKKLMTLEDRLKSRFEWGLTTDIKSPNFETRKAILKRKAEQADLTLSEDISNYIAERLTSNIRELEGIINRINAYKELSEDEITLDLVKDIIKNILPSDSEGEAGKESKKKKDTQQRSPAPPRPQYSSSPPPPPPPAPPQYQQIINRCPACMGATSFIPQYQRWYCANCGMYVEPQQAYAPQQYPQQMYSPAPSQPPPPPPPSEAAPAKKCSACGSLLRFIKKYERYYCDSCGDYEPIEAVANPSEPPPPESKAKPVKKTVVSDAKEKKEKKTEKKAEENSFEEKIIGEAKEEIREIKTGYFLPEGSDAVFSKIVEKLGRLAAQKKFNFFIKPLFAHRYSANAGINYEKIAHLAKTNDIDIALCMMPEEKSGINPENFKKKVVEAMDNEGMPMEIVLHEDIKESDALNLMLDIAICAKKRGKN